jgi:ribonuclease HII
VATLHSLILESLRLRLLGELEHQLHCHGFAAVAGVDEVGRGALAGPVVAAAVVLDPGTWVPGVDDSKRVGAEERERIAALLRRCMRAFAVALVPPGRIDLVNILEASREAMREALLQLRPPPDCAVIDAVPLRGLGYPCLPVVRGDQISYAVACASILAKVERDRMMVDLDRLYPMYGFAAHKGYAAPEHLRALAEYGPSPVHRLTFRSVLPRLDDPEADPPAAAVARRRRSRRGTDGDAEGLLTWQL